MPKVPFTWVGPAASVSDALLIIVSSVAAALIAGGLGLEASFALGLLVTFNLIVLNGYRRNYVSNALANSFRQVREITILWISSNGGVAGTAAQPFLNLDHFLGPLATEAALAKGPVDEVKRLHEVADLRDALFQTGALFFPLGNR